MRAWRVYITVVLLLSAGCAPLNENAENHEVVPLNVVISGIKNEISQFYKTPPISDVKKNTCGFDASKVTPVSFTLDLKSAVKNDAEVHAGLVAPFGVVKFDPSGKFDRSYENTLETKLPLTIKDNGVVLNRKSTAEEVAALQNKFPLAYALWNFREELIKVDHGELPCLGSSGNLTVTLTFDVVTTKNGGFSFQLVGYKLGSTRTDNTTYHQSISFDIPFAGTQMDYG